MDEIFNWLRRHVHGEWTTVTDAPVLFAMAVLFVGLVVFFGLTALFRERIEALQATINHKQSMLDEYKERLHGATPIEVATEIVSLKNQIGHLMSKIDRPQRRLNEDQRQIIISRLKDDPNFVGYWFTLSSPADTESSRFAVLLYDVLLEAGITCNMNNFGRHDEGESGIIFYISEKGADANFIKLADVFEEAGLSITKTTDKRAPDTTYIFIAPDNVDT